MKGYLLLSVFFRVVHTHYTLGHARQWPAGPHVDVRKVGALVPPYVIHVNQTLVQGWIWAFQIKSYLLVQELVQESALYNEVLLFSPK